MRAPPESTHRLHPCVIHFAMIGHQLGSRRETIRKGASSGFFFILHRMVGEQHPEVRRGILQTHLHQPQGLGSNGSSLGGALSHHFTRRTLLRLLVSTAPFSCLVPAAFRRQAVQRGPLMQPCHHKV